MVQIKWCWFHSKIFILGQDMARMPIFGHTFFGLYGNLGDYHLSISGENTEKSKL